MDYMTIPALDEFCRKQAYKLNMDDFVAAKNKLGINADKLDDGGRLLYSTDKLVRILNEMNVPKFLIEDLFDR